MQPVELKTRRELFWDEFLVDEAKGVAVEMHYAQPRGVALTANMLWEGNVSGYTTVFADGNIVRMYYRGADLQFDFDGNVTHQNNGCICYAESRDGKTFYRPELGICEHNGSRKNNIILNDYDYDNFSVFKDANPACPPQELYKGLSAFFSEDGNRL